MRLPSIFFQSTGCKAIRIRTALFSVFFALILVFSFGVAQAKITKTSRVEISDQKQKFYIGAHSYITDDADNKLTREVIASRHKSNIRGALHSARVINIGADMSSIWMVFSVTNMTKNADWVLHFGNLTGGRYGLVKKIQVYNQSTNERVTRAFREQSNPSGFGLDFNGGALPIKLSPQKIEMIVVNMHMEGGLPNTIAPYLISEKNYLRSLRYGNLLTNLMYVFFIVACSIFLATAFLRKDLSFIDFAGYFFFNGILFLLLEQLFFVPFTFVGEGMVGLYGIVLIAALFLTRSFFTFATENFMEKILLIVSGIFTATCILCAAIFFGAAGGWSHILIFMPAVFAYGVMTMLALSQARSGKKSGYYLGGAWALALVTILLMALPISGVLSVNTIVMNLYWLMLWGQAGLFIYAVQHKIKEQDFYQRTLQSRESRAARSVERIQHSKESADQARLLRVIERERELMAELREREIQRTDEMRQAKNAADHANGAKSAFLAVVSHEIRTPMTGLLGMVRLLVDTKLSKQQFEYADAIKTSGETMMALLNDILDFEKIERGGLELEEIEFDLRKLIQGIVTLMSGHAANKNLSLKADIGENIPRFVIGDPTRLRQVLLNLVNNAIKFTEIGGVVLGVNYVDQDSPSSSVQHALRFAVTDTGIGISEDAQKKLFDPFSQANSAITRKYGGTGLGLAICLRLIQAMKSEIEIESATDQGSTFHFALNMPEGQSDQTATGQHMQQEQSVQSEITPLSILVVEDNEMNRKVLHAFLTRDGHTPTIHASAEAGLDALKTTQSFDVIFTDINLDGMDGLGFTKVVRSMKNGAQTIPIVAITGNVTDEHVQSYLDVGMNSFIAKPISPESLQDILLRVHSGEFKAESLSASTIDAEGDTMDVPKPVEQERKVGVSDESEGDVDGLSIVPNILPKKEAREGLIEFAEENEDVVDIDGEAVPLYLKGESLQSLLDNLGADTFKELIDGFIEAADSMVVTMATERDMKELYNRAHELKGMAGNFGFIELSNVAGEIEQAVRDNNESDVSAPIKKLPEVLEKSKTDLAAWLSNQ